MSKKSNTDKKPVSPRVKKPETPGEPLKRKPAVKKTPAKVENTLIKHAETINPPEPKAMEVHHHPEVEKKTLKDYLLEGLMIFIAVTMGYFAESYREYLGDNAKELEYVKNIRKDLAIDTSHLNSWIPAIYSRVNEFDNLIKILETPGQTANGANLYFYARRSSKSVRFEFGDNTITELKSSGNLRLIRKQSVLNNIAAFERGVGRYSLLADIDNKEAQMSYPLIGQLFDSQIFNEMIGQPKKNRFSETIYANGAISDISKPSGNPQLRSHDKDKINELIYYLHQRKTSFLVEAQMLYQQKTQAVTTIQMINKEYRLENDSKPD